MYEYVARVTNVVDGDTVDVIVDLGLKVLKEERLRLAGINTPEINVKDKAIRAAGLLAKDHVTTAVLGRQVLLRTDKPYPDDKYGRWLARVFFQSGLVAGEKLDLKATLICLNDELVSQGLATVYDGTGPRA